MEKRSGESISNIIDRNNIANSRWREEIIEKIEAAFQLNGKLLIRAAIKRGTNELDPGTYRFLFLREKDAEKFCQALSYNKITKYDGSAKTYASENIHEYNPDNLNCNQTYFAVYLSKYNLYEGRNNLAQVLNHYDKHQINSNNHHVSQQTSHSKPTHQIKKSGINKNKITAKMIQEGGSLKQEMENKIKNVFNLTSCSIAVATLGNDTNFKFIFNGKADAQQFCTQLFDNRIKARDGCIKRFHNDKHANKCYVYLNNYNLYHTDIRTNCHLTKLLDDYDATKVRKNSWSSQNKHASTKQQVQPFFTKKNHQWKHIKSSNLVHSKSLLTHEQTQRIENKIKDLTAKIEGRTGIIQKVISQMSPNQKKIQETKRKVLIWVKDFAEDPDVYGVTDLQDCLDKALEQHVPSDLYNSVVQGETEEILKTLGDVHFHPSKLTT